jgi:hypothetical protein
MHTLLRRLALFGLTCGVGSGLCFGQNHAPVVVGDITIPTYQSGRPVPRWSGDSLVARSDTDSVIHFWNGQGQESVLTLSIPGASSVRVRAAAHGPSGGVICGWTVDPVGQASDFLALVSSDGLTTKIIRTGPYAPRSVAIAPDGTLWTVGYEWPRPKPLSSNGGVVRHFDSSGNQIGAFIPESSLTRSELGLGIDSLVASSDRVGWYPGRGSHYFEVSFSGKVQQYPGIQATGRAGVLGLALINNGSVFATTDSDGVGEARQVLLTLDRLQGTWSAPQLPSGGDPPTSVFVLGSQGNQFVMATRDSHVVRFFTVNP